jgi:hypothetical protein
MHFSWRLRSSSSSRIAFIDIDNTLADTWPTLVPGMLFESESYRISSLKPLQGSIDYIRKNFTEDCLCVYLTHRPISKYFVTKSWLIENTTYKNKDAVYLVSAANKKIHFFEKSVKIKNKFKSISVIDDFTYGHESGSVKYYTEIITKVNQLPIDYVGYEEILRINKK